MDTYVFLEPFCIEVMQTVCVQELKEKGLSKAELDSSLKRERRIAEKKLARTKKLVCFKCRQPGHQLADCPQNKGEEHTDRPPAAGTVNTYICTNF